MDDRLALLGGSHVAPIMVLIYEIRQRGLNVPNVDPAGAGVDARLLVLLESPGPQAVNSDFVSCNNPDPSARNLTKTINLSRFPQDEILIWNVVPQCISTKAKNINATSSDIRNASEDTNKLIDLLQSLKVIIFCGRKAQSARKFLRIPTHVKVLETFHPGAMSYNHKDKQEHIHKTFREAREIITLEPPTSRHPLTNA